MRIPLKYGVLFGIFGLASVSYAGFLGGLSASDKVTVSGSTLSSASWNRIVDAVLELDQRTSPLQGVDGKIGIGTVPSEKLHVSGNARVDGALLGGVRKTASSVSESYYTSTSTKASLTLEPGTWMVFTTFEVRASGADGVGWFQWHLRDTVTGTYLFGGTNYWERLGFSAHFAVRSAHAVYEVTGSNSTIALQFPANTTYPVYVKNAHLSAIRIN